MEIMQLKTLLDGSSPSTFSFFQTEFTTKSNDVGEKRNEK
jgi:hypothetical protein